MSISKFFTKTLGANLSNARWSWGATNSQTNQLFLRVWEDELETIDGVERSLILKMDRVYSSAGFPERQRHVEALRNGAQGFGVVCTAKDLNSSGRTIAEFDRERLLRFGGVVDEGDHTYAIVTERVSTSEIARSQSAASSIIPDIKSILGRRGDATEKETLANARVGQGAFRANVLRIWNSQCCVTGSRILDAIRASHVKPWRDSNNDERLAPDIGIPLVATLDALFDVGLITFSDVGEVLLAKKINQDERLYLGLQGLRMSQAPNEKLQLYMAYHRANLFQGDA